MKKLYTSVKNAKGGGKRSRRLAMHVLLALFLVHLGMIIFHIGEERWKNVTEIITQLYLTAEQALEIFR